MNILARLDIDLLARACRNSEVFVGHWVEPIRRACQTFNINTKERLAAFLAQIGHESGSLRYTTEVWGPTEAQRRYEGRKDLGNTQPGDGARFKGHGLIQITGRFNHAKCRDGLRAMGLETPDFEDAPEALAEPQWAALSAAWYWHRWGCNELADAGEFEKITRAINGGLNGQADRIARHEAALAALAGVSSEQDEFVDTLSEPVQKTPDFVHEPLVQLGPEPFQTEYDIPKEQPMAPFLMAALPALIELVPKLGSIFASGSATAQRNVKAAEIVVEAAKNAIGASNEQDLVERIKKDPAAATTAKQAIESAWFQLQEVAGGVEAARKADAAAMQAAVAGVPFWKSSPSFWIAVALLPLVYMIVGNVVGLLGIPLSDEVRSAIANGVVGLVLGGLIGYYYGQSTSRNRGST